VRTRGARRVKTFGKFEHENSDVLKTTYKIPVLPPLIELFMRVSEPDEDVGGPERASTVEVR